MGKWRNSHCNVNNNFICAKSQGVTNPITTPRPTPMPGGCLDGYITFESKCFKFVNDWMDWATTQQRCKDNKVQR